MSDASAPPRIRVLNVPLEVAVVQQQSEDSTVCFEETEQSHDISGLSVGKRYQFAVRLVNSKTKEISKWSRLVQAVPVFSKKVEIEILEEAEEATPDLNKPEEIVKPLEETTIDVANNHNNNNNTAAKPNSNTSPKKKKGRQKKMNYAAAFTAYNNTLIKSN